MEDFHGVEHDPTRAPIEQAIASACRYADVCGLRREAFRATRIARELVQLVFVPGVVLVPGDGAPGFGESVGMVADLLWLEVSERGVGRLGSRRARDVLRARRSPRAALARSCQSGKVVRGQPADLAIELRGSRPNAAAR